MGDLQTDLEEDQLFFIMGVGGNNVSISVCSGYTVVLKKTKPVQSKSEALMKSQVENNH